MLNGFRYDEISDIRASLLRAGRPDLAMRAHHGYHSHSDLMAMHRSLQNARHDPLNRAYPAVNRELQASSYHLFVVPED